MIRNILFLATIIPTIAFTQDLSDFTPFLEPDSSDSYMEYKGVYDISSTAISSGFFNKLYNGEFITTNDKLALAKNLNSSNQFGGILQNELIFSSNLSVFKSWKADFSLRQTVLGNSSFSKDFFDLVFYGNTRFKGETADFSDLNIQYLNYQTLEFGIRRSSDKTHLKLKLGLVKGAQALELDFVNGSIYTADFGEYLDINANASLMLTDTNKTGINAWNGTGIETGFYLQQKINDKLTLEFAVQDLGFISWNNNNLNYKVDSLFHYEGVVVDNIFEFQDSVFNIETNRDSIQGDFTNESNQNTTILPAFIQAKANFLFANKYLVNIGTNYRLNSNYQPQFNSSFGYLIKNENSRLIPALILGYGGYTDLYYGLSIKYRRDKIGINLGAKAINSLISSEGLSQSAYLSLRYYL